MAARRTAAKCRCVLEAAAAVPSARRAPPESLGAAAEPPGRRAGCWCRRQPALRRPACWLGRRGQRPSLALPVEPVKPESGRTAHQHLRSPPLCAGAASGRGLGPAGRRGGQRLSTLKQKAKRKNRRACYGGKEGVMQDPGRGEGAHPGSRVGSL